MTSNDRANDTDISENIFNDDQEESRDSDKVLMTTITDSTEKRSSEFKMSVLRENSINVTNEDSNSNLNVNEDSNSSTCKNFIIEIL